jgi:hypothetical protein
VNRSWKSSHGGVPTDQHEGCQNSAYGVDLRKRSASVLIAHLPLEIFYAETKDS